MIWNCKMFLIYYSLLNLNENKIVPLRYQFVSSILPSSFVKAPSELRVWKQILLLIARFDFEPAMPPEAEVSYIPSSLQLLTRTLPRNKIKWYFITIKHSQWRYISSLCILSYHYYLILYRITTCRNRRHPSLIVCIRLGWSNEPADTRVCLWCHINWVHYWLVWISCLASVLSTL